MYAIRVSINILSKQVQQLTANFNVLLSSAVAVVPFKRKYKRVKYLSSVYSNQLYLVIAKSPYIQIRAASYSKYKIFGRNFRKKRSKNIMENSQERNAESNASNSSYGQKALETDIYRKGKETENRNHKQIDVVVEKERIRQIEIQARVWEKSLYGIWHERYGKDINGTTFTFMTYNVLAQQLLEDNIYLYQHCTPEVLTWAYRSANLLSEIKKHLPDILCLQEVQYSYFDSFWQPTLNSLGYSGFYKKRNHDKCDGCAIFYKMAKLSVVRYVPVDYFKPGVELMNRDNIGQVAMFHPIGLPSDAMFCVANTHLLYNPKRGDVKLLQLMQLLAEIDIIALRPKPATGYYPVIMCGDFNSTPTSPIYWLVTSGQLCYPNLVPSLISGQKERSYFDYSRQLTHNFLSDDMNLSEGCQYITSVKERYEKMKDEGAANEGEGSVSRHLQQLSVRHGILSHNFPFISAYNHFVASSRGSDEVTTHHTRACCTLDYIFYTVQSKASKVMLNQHVSHSHVQDGHLYLMNRYRLMSDQEAMACGGLPNAHQSSDHLPLVVQFFLRT